MTGWKYALTLVVTLSTSACITVPPPPENDAPKTPAPSVPEKVVIKERIVETTTVSDVDRLLSHYAQVSALPKEQWGKELEASRRAYETSAGSYTRMQLALTRLALSNEQKDRDKAFELLQTQLSVKNDSSAEVRALATMLRQLLSENRQLESNLESQKEKLREETRKSDMLKQKLDALVEAERKLLERNRPK